MTKLLPIFLLLGVLLTADSRGGSDSVTIAGLFDENEKDQAIAFKYAVDRINMDRQILPKTVLKQRIARVLHFDSFSTGNAVCELTEEGVAAIFGPQNVTNTGIVKSICQTLEVPHLQTHWEVAQSGLPPVVRGAVPHDEVQRCSADPTIPSCGAITCCNINLYPDPSILSQGLADLIEDMDWHSFTVLYDDDDSLIRLQDVIKLHRPGLGLVTVRQLDPEDDHRPLLKEIQQSGETHILLQCHPSRVLTVLEQAKEVKMMEDYQSYVITDLDTHTVDFKEFKYGRTNITSVRLIDPHNIQVQNAVRDWEQGELIYNNHLDISPHTVKVQTALIYDAVQLFARALNRLDKPKLKITTKALSCDSVEKWADGFRLLNYMKLIEYKGLSGPMRFDTHGRRIFFQLEIIELSRVGFKKIGTWDPDNKINYTRSKDDLYSQIVEKLENKTFIVTSRLGAPYLMQKPNSEGLTGNDRFEGYSINLIDEIAKELNFKYEFELAPDGRYGSYNKQTKKWDGLVKQLLDRKADLAICDLTITYERESAVDFTMPFMTLGISILFSKPVKQPPNLFSFLSPFSLDVWMYMATAYLGVSLLLFILARMTPFEWESPHPCNDNSEELENCFNLVNCLWFSLGSLLAQGCDILPKLIRRDAEGNLFSLDDSLWFMFGALMQLGFDCFPKISPYEWSNPHPCNNEPVEMETTMNLNNSVWHNCGSLMQQGSDIAPKAVSTRMVAGMWWFFTLIMISSYTANLAAFLTNERMDSTIESAEDLAKQNSIKYGAVLGGSTPEFFKNSNFSTYQKMWAAMESARPSVFTASNNEGVERVLKGKRGYAFLMESTSIEYQVERFCDLQQIGGLLDSKGYGIAMPLNSPYRTAISGAVLKMQEDGRLNLLKEKWWKEMSGGESCDEEHASSADSAAELGLANVGGVFVVLLLGCVAGLFMAVLEFLWNIRKIAVEEEISPKEALVMELKFALQCKSSTKPVRKKKSSSKSSQSPGSSIQLGLEGFDQDNYELSRK